MMDKLSKIKCIIVDIDGTLTNENGELNLEAIEKIRELKSKFNMKIVLASGNAYPVLMGLARYIGEIDMVIAENGAIIGYEEDMEIIGDPKIGNKDREIVKEKLGDILVESWQCKYRLVDYSFKRKGEISWEYIYKRTVETILKELPKAEVVFSGVAIHIRDRDVNKGIALEKVMKKLNLNKDEVLAVGDSDVDVEMLMTAGIGVAVANSSENAKRAAKIITSKPYGMGFVEIAEEILKAKYIHN
ncbi:MAG: phosphoglycolate phosphatase [Candidatus Methanomethylicia archaeon]